MTAPLKKNVVPIQSKNSEQRKLLWADWSKMSKRCRELGNTFDTLLPKVVDAINRDLDDNKISGHTASIIFEKMTGCLAKLESHKQMQYKELMAQGGPLVNLEPVSITKAQDQKDIQRSTEKALVELAKLKASKDAAALKVVEEKTNDEQSE